jgi:hypothetical protein
VSTTEGIAGECHDNGGVAAHGDVFDLADFHPGDAHEVTAFQAADIAELGVTGGPVPETAAWLR